MPSWLLALIAFAAALVPAGVFFAIFIAGYGESSGYGTGTGIGTGGMNAAPGPLLGAGIIPAALVIGAAYRAVRRSRRGTSGK